jgi:hypothetical protein
MSDNEHDATSTTPESSALWQVKSFEGFKSFALLMALLMVWCASLKKNQTTSEVS